MKPTDKFGNTIYPKVFRMLQKIGKNLEINGWKESNSKPNLFYKEFGGVLVFANVTNYSDAANTYVTSLSSIQSMQDCKPFSTIDGSISHVFPLFCLGDQSGLLEKEKMKGKK